MDVSEQIQKFQEFIDQNYYADLLEKVRKGDQFLVIDFSLLSKFDPDLADLLLIDPEEVLKAAELSLEQFDLPGDVKGFAIRVMNLPDSRKLMIRNIRSKNIGKMYQIEGAVRQKSDVRPQVTSSKFECPSCGAMIPVLQLDNKFKEPTRCSCGRKGKFRLVSKELVDAQSITLEEAHELLEGGAQPKRMKIFLKNDLVSPLSDKKTNPGTNIIISGIIKEMPIILRTGGQSTRFDLFIEANYIEETEEDFGEISISDEEIEEIKELSKDPELFPKLISSVAPSIYGHDRIKEALLYQQMGGVKKVRNSGAITRGDMHVLLVGDPGSGKSQLLKRIQYVAPKGRYVSGKGVSGAGLTASVVKDEFLQGWSLEAGALVLANKGVCMIDELDKMSREDRSAMHEALEQQSVSISKANIQATLRAETTVLAAANPKFGRFDPYGTIAEQINLPPSLINRFDLIFPIKDLPEKVKDENLAKFILLQHQQPESKEPDVDTILLRKYLAYGKQHVKPILTDESIEEMKDYYLKMRQSAAGDNVRSIPISPRQLEGVIRIAESSAKLRLSKKVTRDDAKRAIDLLDYCLRQIALDEETGMVDIDKIATGMPSSQRNKIITIKEVISELENKLGKIIPIEDVVSLAKEKGVSEEDVDSSIEKLKRTGDLFEPKRGFISRI